MPRQSPPRISQAEGQARAAEKDAAILRWVAEERYSTAAILGQLLGLSKTPTHAALRRLVRQQALVTEELFVEGKLCVLYVCTPHGLALAGSDTPAYQVGRTNPAYVPHRLAIQRARLAAEAAGYTGWTHCGGLKAAGWKKVPDALCTNPQGHVVAIEIERHAKTTKRYEEILGAYLQDLKAGRCVFVDYICPPGVAPAVERTFRALSSVLVMGQRVAVDETHKRRFRFYTEGAWPLAQPRRTVEEAA